MVFVYDVIGAEKAFDAQAHAEDLKYFDDWTPNDFAEFQAQKQLNMRLRPVPSAVFTIEEQWYVPASIKYMLL